MLHWCNKKSYLFLTLSLERHTCCRFGSRTHFNFHQPALENQSDQLAMAGCAPTFARVLTECKVPDAFRAWLLTNTMTDSTRFLLGAPHGVDRDLIETCGLQLSVAERIAIRMAFNVCKTAAADEERARIAASSSPGTADIPTETLQDLFCRRHN